MHSYLDAEPIEWKPINLYDYIFFSGTVSCWGMGTSNQLATGDDEDAVLPVKMGGKQLQNK